MQNQFHFQDRSLEKTLVIATLDYGGPYCVWWRFRNLHVSLSLKNTSIILPISGRIYFMSLYLLFTANENDVSGHVWSITMIQAVVKRIYSTHNNPATCRNCKGI
jgi:hypothetical protein